MKIYTYIMVLMLAVLPAYGAFIQSVDCEKLQNSELYPQTTFEAEAMVCFYGSGFDGSNVQIELDSPSNQYSLSVPVSNGVVTSVSGDYFTGVKEGDYSLIAGGIQSPDLIIVYNNSQVEYPDNETPGEEDPQDPTDPISNVPEFSTVAAGLVLAGAGLYINKRRKVQE